ncbi:PQQ-binding-like beta-propeller repeat protein [Kutzneria kofuensis]|uniref:Pyrrolo-quinoline quinone repeat domain-containing protein n=1 Tax=Kutzneria kofuensis TaxID=103725 RepID=A0A7W9KQ50_9PSEU|nr:PQQ-binding-like beta-propeller repeat protein [Kutzneria kofuensis]MBB5895909.1 hypothetical protein [Kutzneria kofuensis]
MPQPLAVHRVLGDRPFAEVGEPRAVAVDEERGLIAIGGHVGWLHWAGAATATDGWMPHVLGIYDRSDLRCRTLLRTRWPIRSVDFHPRQPLLAIGTGSYDGGWIFHGELLLLHLDSGEVVSALADSREVRAVKWRTWRHGRVLDLALAPPTEFEFGNEAMVIGYDAMVTRDDWLAVRDGEIGHDELDGPLRDSDIVKPAQARADVEALSTAWSYRGPVWGVERLRDGHVLATMDGVRLESWRSDGELDWSTADRGGHQLVVAPDQESALAGDLEVTRYSLRDGKVLETLDSDGVITARADGAFALRPPHPLPPALGPRHADSALTTVFGPDRAEVGHVVLGGFGSTTHFFPVRHASALYFLRGSGQVVSVGDDLVVRPLFDQAAAGPAVEVGDSLVCSGPRVSRRRLPDGEILWRLAVEHPVTALEIDAGGSILYIALNSGRLLGIDVHTGSVLWQQELSIHGQPTVGLSLASAEPGRLLIGTVDGRILDCH